MSARPISQPRRVLIVGIGHPDRGDDGFGARVIQELAGRLPPDVAVRACLGDLLSLINDCTVFDALICVDAADAIDRPGRPHRIDLATGTLPRGAPSTSSHAMGLAEAIELARALGHAPDHIILYAVEGACFEIGAELTPAVAAAVAPVADCVAREAERLRWACVADRPHA